MMHNKNYNDFVKMNAFGEWSARGAREGGKKPTNEETKN